MITVHSYDFLVTRSVSEGQSILTRSLAHAFWSCAFWER